MKVALSDPHIIAESSFVNEPDVCRWGHYQFPVLGRLLDGRIAVTFNIKNDDAHAYGKASLEPNRCVSEDRGVTWERVESDAPVEGMLLPNGERLLVGVSDVAPVAYEIGCYTLPADKGTVIGSYGQEPYVFYRHDELPSDLQGVPTARIAEGASAWVRERARLDDPGFLRYSMTGLFPVFWWGDIHQTKTGELLAVVYPGRIEGPSFQHACCNCYRSFDMGHSWQLQGRIMYQPDRAADPLADKRDGIGEPTSLILPDGEILVVLRTTDGNGDGPLYTTRSKNDGRDWSPPKVMRENGVLPHLLLLGNGVLVLSTGRPGADLTFSVDGRGETWSERYPLVPVEGPGNQDDSCGYTSMLALDDNSFLVTYSWFKKPSDNGQTRKAILVRRVQVTV